MYITKCAFGWTFLQEKTKSHFITMTGEWWPMSICSGILLKRDSSRYINHILQLAQYYFLLFKIFGIFFFLSQFSVDSISLNFIIGTLLCKKKKSFISTWFMNKMFKYWILLIKIINKHIYLEKFQCVTLVSFDFY